MAIERSRERRDGRKERGGEEGGRQRNHFCAEVRRNPGPLDPVHRGKDVSLVQHTLRSTSPWGTPSPNGSSTMHAFLSEGSQDLQVHASHGRCRSLDSLYSSRPDQSRPEQSRAEQKKRREEQSWLAVALAEVTNKFGRNYAVTIRKHQKKSPHSHRTKGEGEERLQEALNKQLNGRLTDTSVCYNSFFNLFFFSLFPWCHSPILCVTGPIHP